MRDGMEKQIKELLECGLIEPSTSEWRSVVMLKKPGDGGGGIDLQLTIAR